MRPGDAQHIVRSQRAGFHRLDGEVRIAIRRGRVGAGWRSKMHRGIDLPPWNENEIRNIMANEREARISRQVRQVFGAAGDEVINADDRMAFI